MTRRLAWAAAAATLALVTLGGVVRITGAGLGCGDDWPLCHGRLLPPLEIPTLVEYGHRLAASAVSLLVLAVLANVWMRRQTGARVRRAATLAAGLIAVQVLLGAVTVWLRLPAASVVLHFTTAMILLAVLVTLALWAGEPVTAPGGSPPGADQVRAAGPGAISLVRAAATLGFATLVLGGLVANLDAGPACQGFPLCNGRLAPAPELPVVVHWTHRLLAFALVGLLAAVYAAVRLGKPGGRFAASARVRRIAGLAFLLGLVQVGVAAAMVLRFMPPPLRALHLTVGALLWAALVALVHASTSRVPRPGLPRPAPAAEAEGGAPAGLLPRADREPRRRTRRADARA
jgi:heme A synthase